MAEQNENETAEAPQKGGMGGLIVGLVIAVAMAGVGFAIPFVFPSLFGGGDQAAVQVGEENDQPPAFIPFDETVVNLNSDRLNRYLRIGITLQVNADDEALVNEQLAAKKAILRSWLITHLADISMDDIRGAAGQNRLRREIQDHFNTTLFEDGYDRIRDVLFEEFNVQ